MPPTAVPKLPLPAHTLPPAPSTTATTPCTSTNRRTATRATLPARAGCRPPATALLSLPRQLRGTAVFPATRIIRIIRKETHPIWAMGKGCLVSIWASRPSSIGRTTILLIISSSRTAPFALSIRFVLGWGMLSLFFFSFFFWYFGVIGSGVLVTARG